MHPISARVHFLSNTTDQKIFHKKFKLKDALICNFPSSAL